MNIGDSDGRSNAISDSVDRLPTKIWFWSGDWALSWVKYSGEILTRRAKGCTCFPSYSTLLV